MRRRRWTSAQDLILIGQGRLYGYARTARHELRCSPSAARSRMRRLRIRSPETVSRIEGEARAKGLLA